MIKVITIEREYGCGGSEVAAKIAARLNWKLWDQILTSEIARLAHCDQAEVEQCEERTDSLYYRLLKSFLRGSQEGSLNAQSLKMLDADNMVKFSEQVVERAAAAGSCVIVGRGSQHFLQHRADTLRVFFYAPREEKIRRVKALGKTRTEAATLVDTVDRERAAFIKKYFHAEWPNRSLYQLMVNTAAGEETAVRAVLNFMAELNEARRSKLA